MKEKRLLLVGVLAIIAFAGSCLGIYKLIDKEDTKKETISDAIKFKREYESLNGTVRQSDGEKYNSVTIPKDNPIKYIDCKEALDVLEKEQAIIYVGAEWCPWCRNAVPVLFEVAKDYNVDTIYYLNLDDEKSQYEIKNGKLTKTTNGSESYYKLLERLSDRLNDYTIKDDNGNYTKSTNIPIKNSGYTFNSSLRICDGSSIISWDNDAWGLELDNINRLDTKCYLYFDK